MRGELKWKLIPPKCERSSLLSALDPVPDGVAVQPVLLDYGSEAADIAWIGEEHGLDNFKRILTRARPLRMSAAAPLDGPPCPLSPNSRSLSKPKFPEARPNGGKVLPSLQSQG